MCKVTVSFLDKVEPIILSTLLRHTNTITRAFFLRINFHTIHSTFIFVSLHVSSTNRHFIILTTALFRIDRFTFTPMKSLTTSKTIKETRIKISSVISTTNRLYLITTLTFTEDFRIINFIISTNTIILFSEFSTFHQTLISISSVINTTYWDISLMTLTIFFDRRTSGFTEKFNTSAL